jgi:hypothetical protein
MEHVVQNLIHKKSDYIDDKSYRHCMRQIFEMTEKEPDERIDELSNDENNYDEEQMARSMDFIYEKTKNHALFQTLYQHGAAKMFSLNNEIGLAVLCSYDYFHLFHQCLRVFVQENELTEQNVHYQNLFKKLN